MNARRWILLGAWILTLLQLPETPLEVVVAAGGALLIYVGLQLALTFGQPGLRAEG